MAIGKLLQKNELLTKHEVINMGADRYAFVHRALVTCVMIEGSTEVREFESFYQREDAMKVKIDYDLCMGDQNCHKVCPEVFDFDEDQLRSIVRVDGVPAHLEDKVRKAAEECAPGAILIEA